MYIYNNFSEKVPEFRFLNEKEAPKSFGDFGDFGDINIFVGENNSGKSNFLRRIIKQDKVVISSFSIDEFQRMLGELKGGFNSEVRRS